MSLLTKKQAANREKTLLMALLLSVPGPLVVGLAAVTSHSTTQLADFIRRSVELVALFLSWWVFRQLQRDTMLNRSEASRLENAAGLAVAITMTCSAIIMVVVALSRWSVAQTGGNVIPGLTIAFLGLLTNAWFWRRYTVLTREHYSAVTDAQQNLYRAKASVDLCVVIALSAVAMAPAHPATHYVDVLGSIAVAGYLLWSGLRMARPHLAAVELFLQRLVGRIKLLFRPSISKDNDSA